MLREIDIMKRLDHPHIIKFIEHYEFDSELLLVLEFMNGIDLFDYIIQKQKLLESEAVFIFYQITSAVHYIHELNVIYF